MQSCWCLQIFCYLRGKLTIVLCQVFLIKLVAITAITPIYPIFRCSKSYFPLKQLFFLFIVVLEWKPLCSFLSPKYDIKLWNNCFKICSVREYRIVLKFASSMSKEFVKDNFCVDPPETGQKQKQKRRDCISCLKTWHMLKDKFALWAVFFLMEEQRVSKENISSLIYSVPRF